MAGNLNKSIQAMYVEFFSELCWGKAIIVYAKPNSGRKKKVKGQDEREMRSSLLILDLKEGKNYRKEEKGKTFHKLHVLWMDNALCDRVRR